MQAQMISQVDSLKLWLVERINQDRAREGARAVRFSAELSMTADQHCGEMLREKYTSHWHRSGWKPYIRYSQNNVNDHTSENIASIEQNRFKFDVHNLWKHLIERHESFLDEKPPNDLHRRSVLDPRHTHVGIGIAFDASGLKLIEVFAHHYLDLDPVPLRASLGNHLLLRGTLLSDDFQIKGVSIFYEPFPAPLSVAQLERTHAYSFPDSERVLYPRLAYPNTYADGRSGLVQIYGRRFSAPILFVQSKPGVYTAAVWISEKKRGSSPFIASEVSIFVE